jgi:RNA polymerase sigma-70 factor (ECF subfamily)
LTRSAQSGVKFNSSNDQRERELLQRIAAEDREAMRELYLAYHRRLARFLARLTARHEVVEEIINDTLVIVWQQADKFRADSRVSTWIFGIAYRHGLKTLRAESRATRHMVAPLPADGPAGDLVAERAELSDLLARASGTLSVEQRAVLAFTYVLGLSCEEIAVAMGCPVNTVKTRMFYARQRLRTALPALGARARET